MTPPPLREGLTEKQLDTLRHMLGINTPSDREPKPYRNHYAANPGDAEMLELTALGMVEFAGIRYELHYYQCTDAGRAVAMRSHRTIRLTKAKRIYRKFLDVSDCCPDLTFKEFITSPEFADSRRAA